MPPSAQSNSRKAPNRASGTSPIAVVPFTAAAHEHNEPGGFDFTVTPGANTQQFGPFDVPAYGYLRHIWILVEGSGGVAGTAAADAPFNLFSEITLLDVNGAPIFGPFTGYQTFLANYFGSYAFRPDPRKLPEFVGTGANFLFAMRIPVEINHNNGLGALSNQNAASAYKVRVVVNTAANIWSVAPTTIPTFRVSALLEAWTQPNPQDLAGRPQATAPPSHGTTQFWSQTSKGLVTGDNTILIPRVGNLIRNVLLVFRNSSGVRQAVANWPDPMEWRWDARQLLYERKYHRRGYMAERFGELTADAGIDGVAAYTLTHDVLGHAGDGTAELWWPTVQSSRLEFHSAAFPAALSGGTIEVLMNDVAPVEVNPGARFDENSATGFHPQGGVVVGAG